MRQSKQKRCAKERPSGTAPPRFKAREQNRAKHNFLWQARSQEELTRILNKLQWIFLMRVQSVRGGSDQHRQGDPPRAEVEIDALRAQPIAHCKQNGYRENDQFEQFGQRLQFPTLVTIETRGQTGQQFRTDGDTPPNPQRDEREREERFEPWPFNLRQGRGTR